MNIKLAQAHHQARGSCSCFVTAVSYTHLDVYKRQVLGVGRSAHHGWYHGVVKTAPNPPQNPAPTAQPVPMLDLKRQYRPLHQELVEAVAHVLETQQFILGEPVAAFEREAAAQLGVKHGLGCSSGTEDVYKRQK